MLLHLPRQSVQVARPRMRRKRLPLRERNARRFYCRIDVCRGTLRNGGQWFARRRIERVEINALGRRPEGAADEVAELAGVPVQPHQCLARILWGWTVFHGEKFFSDTHDLLSSPSEQLVAIVMAYASGCRYSAEYRPVA